MWSAMNLGFRSEKEAHNKAPKEAPDESIGDAYCFIAIERNTKLVLNLAFGRRSRATTDIFIEDLRRATSRQHFQNTTAEFAPYVKSISDTLGDRVDFGQLIKIYQAPLEGMKSLPWRWSQLSVALIGNEFAPASSNARISRSICKCAA
jgi:hypothetical protein